MVIFKSKFFLYNISFKFKNFVDLLRTSLSIILRMFEKSQTGR